MPWICEIYENRPDLCKRYPEPGSFVPNSCGFHFPGDGTRRGRCEPECEATCCKLPRVGGDPTATSLPEAAGGLPCKYLVYSEEDVKFTPERLKRFDEEGVSDQPDTPDLEI